MFSFTKWKKIVGRATDLSVGCVKQTIKDKLDLKIGVKIKAQIQIFLMT